MGRDLQIWRLVQLGYTQKEIAQLFGLEQPAISKIIPDLKNPIRNIRAQHAKGRAVSEIAEFEGIDESRFRKIYPEATRFQQLQRLSLSISMNSTLASGLSFSFSVSRRSLVVVPCGKPFFITRVIFFLASCPLR
jgi:predicted transcriptional regulator